MELIGYARVSTYLQADNTSLEDQKTRLAAYCVAHGYELADIYQDIESGGSLDRPGLARALEDLRLNKADGIAVCYLDRLARNTADFLALMDSLKKQNKSVIALDVNLDTSTAIGTCVATILMAMFQLLKDQTKEKSAAARAYLKSQGKRYAGQPPYGYRVKMVSKNGKVITSNELEPNEEEQSVVAYIRELAEADLSCAAIAAQLNDRHYRTRKGCAWTYKQVQRIIKDEMH